MDKTTGLSANIGDQESNERPRQFSRESAHAGKQFGACIKGKPIDEDRLGAARNEEQAVGEKQLSCEAVLTILGTAVLVGVFFWKMPGTVDPTESSAWASWVQAFGSIGAIAGAFWLAESRRRQEAAERADERNVDVRERLYFALEMIKECCHALVETYNKLTRHENGAYPFRAETVRLEQMIELLRGFIADRCPPVALGDMIDLYRQMVHALEHLRAADGCVVVFEEAGDFERRVERFREKLDSFTKTVDVVKAAVY